jgi:enoyl-CoA hydratase
MLRRTQPTEPMEPPVLVQRRGRLASLVLNRARVLNTLNLETIRLLHGVLEEARVDSEVRLIVLSGAGERGFCAGGDLKELFRTVQSGALQRADEFFREEYALDLLIHQFPKPVVALVDGITMGGGLGLAAGADIVVATERSRMAMPETRIGFFPDVGATGWLFERCMPGYPEYLALTGYEVMGGDCIRLGLATHLVKLSRLPELWTNLTSISERLGPDKGEAVRQVESCLDALAEKNIPSLPELDAWVAEHFAGKQAIEEIVASLQQCSLEATWCREVFERLAERSPTALALTLRLLRANEGRPLAEVFQREALAAHFMTQHPDYMEGIRARIIEKDDKPCWQHIRITEIGNLELKI